MNAAAGTLIFDGDCGFCTSTANYIAKHSDQPIEIFAWQLTDVSRFGLTVEQTAQQVYFVRDGRAFGGHEAFAQILRSQNNPIMRGSGFLLMVPPFSWFARIGYRLVAKYRHRLPGGTPACKLEN